MSRSGVASVGLVVLLLGCGPSKPAEGPPTQVTEPPVVDGEIGEPVTDPVGGISGTAAVGIGVGLPKEMPTWPATTVTVPKLGASDPAAPRICRKYTSSALGDAGACEAKATALASLNEALNRPDPISKVASLLALKGCKHLAPGLVVALAAETAPIECADVIVADTVKTLADGGPGELRDALVGLAVAGRLARAVTTPPKMKGPATKAVINKFINNRFKGWAQECSARVDRLSAIAKELRFYGQALVAIESANADMSLVAHFRAAPVPDEFRKDTELLDVYRMSIEDALRPRRERARGAALVALGVFANVGVLHHRRLDTARTLLKRTFGGSAIKALDALILPPLASKAPSDPSLAVEQDLAGRLPSFYSGLLLNPALASSPWVMEEMLFNGLPLAMRIHLRDHPDPTSDYFNAVAQLDFARLYWRKRDVDAAVASSGRAAKGAPTGIASRLPLLLATAAALQSMPQNIVVVLAKPTDAPLTKVDVSKLDALAEATDWFAPRAAFNAGVLSELGAPPDADAPYWQAVASRYATAEAKFKEPKLRRRAADRRAEAEATARAVSKR